MVVEQRQPARKKVVRMKTGLNFAIIFICWKSEMLVILFFSPKVRRFSMPALLMVKKELEREAMATEVCHDLSSSLRSSAGVQKRTKKMTAIWKVDSNWASLKNIS